MGGQLGRFETPRQKPLAPACELVLHKQLEELQMGKIVVGGLGQTHWQRLDHARKAQAAQLAFKLDRDHGCSPSLRTALAYSQSERMIGCSWVSATVATWSRLAASSARRRTVR